MASQGGRRASSTRADVSAAPPDASSDEAARVETSDAFARKERILGVAERLFRHYGPAKTTVAEIARACGIGVGTVYLDFASKEEILEALAAQRHEEIVERMTVAARGVEDPRERVARMLEARTLAFLDLAERGVHACDLVRCADTIMAGRRAAGAGAPKPNAAPTSFGARAREVLRKEMVQLRGQPHDVDVAVEAIELAFVALSPPYVTRLDRERALALSRALARLLVFGV
jgi:AcrR family transcriptional regulator